MNTKRYTNGVRWLGSHGFDAQESEPCCHWIKDGVSVCFFVNDSHWYAFFNGWMGEYCTTPKSAIESLHEVFERERRSLLKQAQFCFKAAERVGNILKKQEDTGNVD